MMNALYSAATGMMAQQTSMDVVANNLANATTTGYKRDRMDLVNLEYQAFRLPTGTDGQVGLGAAPGQIAKEHAQGSIQNTGRGMDVAIQGEGFFQVTRADGSLAYTRAGNLQIDANGRVALPTGDLLQPRIDVPAGASDVTIGAGGDVSATVNGAVTKLGTITVAMFANPAGLQAAGDNLFVAQRQLRRRRHRHARHGRARPALPGLPGGLERERRHRDDLPHRHPARVRGLQQGGQRQ